MNTLKNLDDLSSNLDAAARILNDLKAESLKPNVRNNENVKNFIDKVASINVRSDGKLDYHKSLREIVFIAENLKRRLDRSEGRDVCLKCGYDYCICHYPGK